MGCKTFRKRSSPSTYLKRIQKAVGALRKEYHEQHLLFACYVHGFTHAAHKECVNPGPNGKPHIPPPRGPITGVKSVNPPRNLTPLSVPTKLVPLPSPLPTDLSRNGNFTPTHSVSVHLLPAAFPRSASPVGPVEVPPMDSFASKEDRGKWLNKALAEVLWVDDESRKFHPDPRAGFKLPEIGLWSAVMRVKRNVRAEDRKGVTIVATHPIGFHKEIWEPVFRHLIELTERPDSPIRIDEIWALDNVAHGDAALINGRYLPKLPDRRDYGRDIANLLINFLPEKSGQEIPQILERLPASVTSQRAGNGLANRLILGLGHSLGADATVRCALEWPAIFNAVVVAESTLFPATQNGSRMGSIVIKSTLGRRSSWPSREEAKKGLLKSPLFAAWDPAAVDAYVRWGMYEDPKTGQVHLKCTPGMEAAEFTRRQTMNEAFELMPTIDEGLEMRWIMGSKEGSSALVGGPEVAQTIIWRRPKNTTNILIPGGGHLVVQEQPRAVAEDVAMFIRYKFANEKKVDKARL